MAGFRRRQKYATEWRGCFANQASKRFNFKVAAGQVAANYQ
jgi:hypothetical protein